MTTNAGVHEKGKFALSDVISSVKTSDGFEKAGAIALFIGVARGETLTGEKVQKLTLEAYEEKANQVLEKICDDLSKKPGIVNVQIHHLLGDFDVTEDMVYVSVAGSHQNRRFPRPRRSRGKVQKRGACLQERTNHRRKRLNQRVLGL